MSSIHVILEAALQQIVRERAEQVFHAHLAGRIGNVFAVANAFHRSSRRSSVVGRWPVTCRSVTADLRTNDRTTSYMVFFRGTAGLPVRTVFSAALGCFSPAVNTRSSLRPMRLWAYRPSSTNSAAETCNSGLSFGPTPSLHQLFHQTLNAAAAIAALRLRRRASAS